MTNSTVCRLQHYPYKTVRLACSTCDLQERFGKDRLIAEHGFDVTMRDLQHLIARCDRARNRKAPCGAFYPDLMND